VTVSFNAQLLSTLYKKSAFPINNSSSFGFIRGLGPQDAVKRALALRRKYAWCLKTDIQSFFDKIQRPYLKKKVTQALKGSRLELLIHNVIDCEVQHTPENKEKLRKQGLAPTLGITQGMPLSPLLANLALADFDKEVERKRRGILVRYADDLVLFYRTREEAEDGRKITKLLLATVQLSIPEIADGSKTKIMSRCDPLEFLGREIVHLGSIDDFVARVSSKQISKIKERLASEFSFKKQSIDGKTLQNTVTDLSKSIAAYLGIYRDAFNYSDFQADLKGLGRVIIAKIFQDLFGSEHLQSLTPEGGRFLGIEILDDIDPNAELDV
jgi:RNA-directed DNA polymerase